VEQDFPDPLCFVVGSLANKYRKPKGLPYYRGNETLRDGDSEKGRH